MSSSNGTNAGSDGLSAAKKLEQMHDAHNPVVEDLTDESDLRHPPAPLDPRHILEDLDEPAAAGNWPANISANAAGKRKAEVTQAPSLDPNSETSFPILGGAKIAPVLTPIWGGTQTATNGTKNGIATNGASNPASATNTPPAVQIHAPRLVLQRNEVLPRTQLKKPVPEILKDINKKLRTNLTMRTGENGILEFRETSNQKEALKQQAIRDLGVQIGAKVGSPDARV